MKTVENVWFFSLSDVMQLQDEWLFSSQKPLQATIVPAKPV